MSHLESMQEQLSARAPLKIWLAKLREGKADKQHALSIPMPIPVYL